MSGYYGDWKESIATCRKCSWQGTGEQCKVGEIYRELIGYDCPSCGEEIFVITLPTIEESRQNWDKVSDVDKLQIQLAETLAADFSKRSLKSPDQLPDISLEGKDDDLILVWDVEDYQLGGDTLIKYGKEIIWREPSSYEDYERFIAVGKILKQKYGNRLQDLVPSRRSWLQLYGDSLAASGIIDKYRETLWKFIRDADKDNTGQAALCSNDKATSATEDNPKRTAPLDLNQVETIPIPTLAPVSLLPPTRRVSLQTAWMEITHMWALARETMEGQLQEEATTMALGDDLDNVQVKINSLDPKKAGAMFHAENPQVNLQQMYSQDPYKIAVMVLQMLSPADDTEAID